MELLRKETMTIAMMEQYLVVHRCWHTTATYAIKWRRKKCTKCSYTEKRFYWI